MTLTARHVAVLLLALAVSDDRAIAAVPPDAALEDDSRATAEVLALADERLALMPAVAAAKWPRHQPVSDPAREAEVVAAAGQRAAAAGLDREPVERLMTLQIALARATQEALYERWQANPAAEHGALRSLSDDLRPALDRLTGEFIRALYVAAPALRRGDFENFAAPLLATTLPAERWEDAARTELLRALGRVRLSLAPSVQRARGAGVLRIGTTADYAPFSSASGTRVAGVDIELALDLAAATGLRPVFVHSSWRTLLDDLAADRFDIAVGGISVTPARQQVAEFSAPTARAGKTAVGRCRDRVRLNSLAALDRADVTVVENPGGTNESFARRSLRHARLVIHADNVTVFDELSAGRADAMFTDETEVALVTHRHPELCRLLRESFEPADKAFLLAPRAGWQALVDPWLAAENAHGTPQALLREYSAH